MAGIYIHIPFCKKACHYCNFHFSTSFRHKEAMIAAILKEIRLQKDYLQGQNLESIYFGGGTPSLLSASEIQQIIDEVAKYHPINTNAEITLEANPDDLTLDKLKQLKTTPINRFSIGIQSFIEEDLKLMNRAHNALEAEKCIQYAQEVGFYNLTIDLIYGTPTMSNEQWKANLEKAFSFGIPHISCYALTVEPNTAMEHFIKVGKMQPVEEEKTAQQFEILVAAMKHNGYEHYEISNFALPNRYAVHNSNYWKGEHYLGIGPSAHSFNGHSRQWNIAHNAKYLKQLQQDKVPFELEELSKVDQYNEYLLTGFRTKWGVSIEKIKTWGDETAQQFVTLVQPYLKAKKMQEMNGNYVLTAKGKLLADDIIGSLFLE